MRVIPFGLIPPEGCRGGKVNMLPSLWAKAGFSSQSKGRIASDWRGGGGNILTSHVPGM